MRAVLEKRALTLLGSFQQHDVTLYAAPHVRLRSKWYAFTPIVYAHSFEAMNGAESHLFHRAFSCVHEILSGKNIVLIDVQSVIEHKKCMINRL